MRNGYLLGRKVPPRFAAPGCVAAAERDVIQAPIDVTRAAHGAVCPRPTALDPQAVRDTSLAGSASRAARTARVATGRCAARPHPSASSATSTLRGAATPAGSRRVHRRPPRISRQQPAASGVGHRRRPRWSAEARLLSGGPPNNNHTPRARRNRSGKSRSFLPDSRG